MKDNTDGGTAMKPVVPMNSHGKGIGDLPRVTQIPAETVFVVDLTIKSADAEPQFKRVLVTSMIEAIALIVAPETTEYYVTALQGRSAENPRPLIRSVAKVDALPPSVIMYTLDDGDQFVIVDDGEPRRMLMCMDMGSGWD